MPTMPEVPDEANLQRLGLYDPEAPDAEDWLKLVHHIFEMGATREEAVAAAAIGGLGSLWGTFAGGIILAVAQSLGAQFDPKWQLLAGHIVFLAVLAVRPEGLFPKIDS